MEAARFVDAIRSELGRLAALGDNHVATVTERLAAALEGPLVLQLAEAAANWAAEASAQLPAGELVVRLADGHLDVLYLDRSEEQSHARSLETSEDGDDLSARISLRLPAGLKERVDRAAADGGASTNAWIVRAISRALDQQGPPGQPPGVGPQVGRRRLSGYGRS